MSDFLVIPAIELRAGMALKYENVGMGTRAARADPVAAAQELVDQGAQWIHLYNLDGPFDVSEAEHSGSVLQGAQRNLDAVMMMSRRIKTPLQFGGGVRDGGGIKRLLALGAKRVALGEAAMRDPAMAKAALKAHGDAVLISINAKDGVAVGQEWVRDNPKLRAEELAAHLKEAGAKTVIYHDAAAEAAGQGPAVMYASRVGKAGVDVLVAGGIASLAHIRQCAATPGIAGVLAGKALAQGKFTLKQALETATEGFKERK
jgi:phosphoribosylformimino-5-aminoimidazole carboxamide ribotide isomerase